MKKYLTFFIITLFFTMPAFSAVDKHTEEYLKNNKNPFSASFLGESIVSSSIKHALKKEAPGRYKVKFKGYSLSSLKKGIFKYLEVTGKNVTADDIKIPFINIKTVTDYNWIDYNQNPVVFKSDIECDFIAHLSETTINDALASKDYERVLRKVNKRAFPVFEINEVRVNLKNNKMYVIMDYNFPLARRDKDLSFTVSSKLKVVNDEVRVMDVLCDGAYKNLQTSKVANLLNMLNPLTFAVKLIDDKHGEVRIKEIEISDDIVIINGKIYIKGEAK